MGVTTTEYVVASAEPLLVYSTRMLCGGRRAVGEVRMKVVELLFSAELVSMHLGPLDLEVITSNRHIKGNRRYLLSRDSRTGIDTGEEGVGLRLVGSVCGVRGCTRHIAKIPPDTRRGLVGRMIVACCMGFRERRLKLVKRVEERLRGGGAVFEGARDNEARAAREGGDLVAALGGCRVVCLGARGGVGEGGDFSLILNSSSKRKHTLIMS
ncbi:hypothetical protein Tco_0000460 [Tanacetum coccineum]